jgi:hypothetical protein
MAHRTGIDSYIALISEFLEGNIGDTEFERMYIELFQNDKNKYGDKAFRILDQLFCDVDAYCADDELRDHNDLNLDGLKTACRRTIERLVDLEKIG